MKTVSFAQNGEDVLLSRVFQGRSQGCYIDVGACHPVFHSVTKLFYDRGWRGVNIEPIPRMFDELSRDRPHDINLHAGLSNREGTIPFHESPAAVGYSTFSPDQTEDLKKMGYELVEHLVRVTTLRQVCEEHADSTIDFLKIDVESHEREVIEGGDWDRFRPRVVLVEATRPEKWEHLLLSADYQFALFDGLNRYYVRAEDRDLLPVLSTPVNVFDEFESLEHHLQVQELEARVAELQHSLEQMRGQFESGQAELDAARVRLDLDEDWGPMTLGVARRLRKLSKRFPMASTLLKRAVVLRRGA